MDIPILPLTDEAFRPFGHIIDWPRETPSEQTGFTIIFRSPDPTGWRLAVSRIAERSVQRLARHPRSAEMFAPVDGSAILVVAAYGPFSKEGLRAFVIDRAVCVTAGVWHATAALSGRATLLIAENLDVSSETVEVQPALSLVLS